MLKIKDLEGIWGEDAPEALEELQRAELSLNSLHIQNVRESLFSPHDVKFSVRYETYWTGEDTIEETEEVSYFTLRRLFGWDLSLTQMIIARSNECSGRGW